MKFRIRTETKQLEKSIEGVGRGFSKQLPTVLNSYAYTVALRASKATKSPSPQSIRAKFSAPSRSTLREQFEGRSENVRLTYAEALIVDRSSRELRLSEVRVMAQQLIQKKLEAIGWLRSGFRPSLILFSRLAKRKLPRGKKFPRYPGYAKGARRGKPRAIIAHTDENYPKIYPHGLDTALGSARVFTGSIMRAMRDLQKKNGFKK